MKTKKQNAYQKATARMDREVNRAVAHVEMLRKLYAEMIQEKNAKVSS
jgi:DNA-binding protein